MECTFHSRNFFALIWIFSWSAIIFQLKVTAALNNTPPNVIIVLTDDQDVVLNGMTPMQRTQKLLADTGATFINAFTSSPVCCPSRASGSMHTTTVQQIIQCQVAVTASDGSCKQNSGRSRCIFVRKYRTTDVPAGFTDWYGLLGNSKYYNYTLNENGVLKSFGDQEQEYLTDVLRVRLEKFLSVQLPEKPFLAIVAPPAAHEPFTPATRHATIFSNITALRTPNFNVQSGILDKHWLVRMPPSPLSPEIVTTIDHYYRQRWQTLLAVDELIESMVTQLKRQNLYDNTYIIFTSDNGYHMGQFSMPYDKRQPYETDIRVPFIVTGPGIQAKHVVDHPISLIDIAPTIFGWAGFEKPDTFDGQSFAEHVNFESNAVDNVEFTSEKADYETSSIGQHRFEREILIEYWGEGNTETYNSRCPWNRHDKLMRCTLNAGCHCQDSWNNTYGCVRHIAHDLDKIYCEFFDSESFVEAHDLIADPFQMTNLGFDMLPSERSTYSLHLDKMLKCVENRAKDPNLE